LSAFAEFAYDTFGFSTVRRPLNPSDQLCEDDDSVGVLSRLSLGVGRVCPKTPRPFLIGTSATIAVYLKLNVVVQRNFMPEEIAERLSAAWLRKPTKKEN
jgi:hypothetical protein